MTRRGNGLIPEAPRPLAEPGEYTHLASARELRILAEHMERAGLKRANLNLLRKAKEIREEAERRELWQTWLDRTLQELKDDYWRGRRR